MSLHQREGLAQEDFRDEPGQGTEPPLPRRAVQGLRAGPAARLCPETTYDGRFRQAVISQGTRYPVVL